MTAIANYKGHKIYEMNKNKYVIFVNRGFKKISEISHPSLKEAQDYVDAILRRREAV